MTTYTSGYSDPAWNLVRPRSWCWKVHFETKKQSQEWKDWSFMYFSVRWNWITLLSADCYLSQYQNVCESIKNWFQLIYPNLTCMLYCVPLPSVYDFKTSYVSSRNWSLNFTHMSCNLPHPGFSEAILSVFQLFYQKNTWNNLQIIFIWWKWFKKWNNFDKEFVSEGVEAAYIARTIIFLYNYLKSCVWWLLVAVTLPFTSASCERSFSKIKLVKTFPRNFMTNERLGNTDLLSTEGYTLKNIFTWFHWLIWQSTWLSKD